jgi:hypothetical protein
MVCTANFKNCGLKTKKIQRVKDGTASIILIMQAKDKIITSAGLTTTGTAEQIMIHNHWLIITHEA